MKCYEWFKHLNTAELVGDDPKWIGIAPNVLITPSKLGSMYDLTIGFE